MNSSEKIRKAVAGYFNDPRGTANLLGTTMSGNGVSVTQDETMKRWRPLPAARNRPLMPS